MTYTFHRASLKLQDEDEADEVCSEYYWVQGYEKYGLKFYSWRPFL